MTLKLLRSLIIGPPGSGKGTISARIVKDFAMKYLSSGDLLRSQILNKTAAGSVAKKYIDEGTMVPDEIIVDLIVDELHKMRTSSWLLDGFPRTVPQAEALYDREPLDVVVNLNIPDHIIIDRIKGRWTHTPSGRIYHTQFNPPKVPGTDDVTGEPLVQREDDKEETVRRRLEGYQELTKPVLQFYREQGILQEFKGKYSNEIWPKVHKYMSTKITPLQYTEYK